MPYTPTVWKTGDVVSSLKLNKIETELSALDTDKANIDGYYESMTVGNAEQLVATVGVEDSVPFNFCTTGGSADVGDRKTMEVVGGTVAWNQMFDISTFGNLVAGTKSYDPTNKEVTVTPTNYSSNSIGIYTVTAQFKCIANHVYYVNVDIIPDKTGQFKIGIESKPNIGYANGGANTSFAYIPKPTTSDPVVIYLTTGSTWEGSGTFKYKNVSVIDLTQMFGSTIADHIYSLEQANAGAGVAWFKKLFPKPYYAYNAGELMSVKTSAYKTTGFNQWDEEWEIGDINGETGQNQNSTLRLRSKGYIPVEPSTQYFFCADSAITGITWVRICYYDAEKNFISTYSPNKNNAFTTPNNASFMRFCTPDDWGGVDYTGGICINLHWDGERDGEYEPYETHTYALDSDLELRGIPKLDADNQLYYDGDIYESDGNVTRKYKVYDLGTMTWYIDSSRPGVAYSPSKSSELKRDGGIMSANYVWWADSVPSPSTIANYNKLISLAASYGGGYIYVVDHAFDSLTAEEVKAALSGVYAVIEITTSTTETADPYTTPQIVNDFGTEEFVDTRTIPIPVGHNSKYQANLRAKLEMAPNSPSGDGDYIVRQSGGQNTYVPITFPADELPAAPTTDGNYVLKCTVSSGTATFEWEAQT